MHVAADQDRVRRLAGGKKIEQAASCRRVAVPAIGPGGAARAVDFPVELGEQRLLRDHVPGLPRGTETGLEPLLLLSTEQRSLRIGELRAFRDVDRISTAAARSLARLRRAVLAVVDDEERGEVREIQARVDAGVR